MQAVVYRGVSNLQVEQLPVPKIGRSEVLVRVAACGVCPTDIKKIQHGILLGPRIYGHETSGRIVKVGSSVTGWKEGQRVGLHHHVPCLKCHACRHRAYAQCDQYKQTGITAGFEPAGGGYAEYVRVMKHCLPGMVPIPKNGTFAEGAMLEPVNTVLKAIRRLELQPRDHVLVAGQGPIGLIFTRLFKLYGMKVHATDLMEWRRQKALQMGAASAHDPTSPEFESQIQELTRGRGVDAAVIAVDSDEAVRQAQKLCRGGGQVCLFAHTRRGVLSSLDFSIPCVDEKQLLGSYSTDITLQNEVARLVFSKSLDVGELITHRFPLEQTGEAVNLAAKPTQNALKVMVIQEEAEALRNEKS